MSLKPADLFQPLLPQLSALTVHHVEPRQDDKLGLELFQARHKSLHWAHLPVGHVVRKDEAVGLRCLSWTPFLTWRQRRGAHTHSCDITHPGWSEGRNLARAAASSSLPALYSRMRWNSSVSWRESGGTIICSSNISWSLGPTGPQSKTCYIKQYL